MQKSIKSLCKKASETSSSNVSVPVNNQQCVDTVKNVNKVNENYIEHHTVNSVNISKYSIKAQYRPDKNFKFPKTLMGKRERRCQYQWFENFSWLHYDVEKDCAFCFICQKHQQKLTAEHNKDPCYISTGFKNWKKAPHCYKLHEQSKCHTAALTYESIVPNCADPIEMFNNDS